MSIHRHAAQRDQNEPEIIRSFEAMGWQVVRHTAYDLEVQCPRCGCHLAVEVKFEKGRLTESQKQLQADGWRLHIVRSPAGCVDLVRDHAREAHH